MRVPPPGVPPGSAPPSGTNEPASFYAGAVRAKFGAAAAQRYLQLVAQYKGRATPYEVFNDYYVALALGASIDAAAKAVADAVGTTGRAVAAGLPPSPLAGIDELGAVARTVFAALTDLPMWRSLGYAVLGVVLLVAGARLWLGKPALPSLPSAAPV